MGDTQELDNFDDYFEGQETVVTRDPPRQDDSNFDKRNDPKPLLKRFKLNLLNAYEVEEKVEDKEGIPITIKKIKRIPGTKPKANKQGIEDIMRYLESIINSHTVQANLDTKNDFNIEMKHIAFDITNHFLANRKDWGITIRDVDILVSNAVNMTDLFLTRALYNKEREGYSEGFKEITSKHNSPEKKKNMIDAVANWFSRGKN